MDTLPFDRDAEPENWTSPSPDRREGDEDILSLLVGRSNGPFVWQHGQRLLLLDEDAGIWSVAELEFDKSTCRYVEIRRSGYDTEREAIGAVLSRALASGFEEVVRASKLLNSWLLRNFGHTIEESRARPRLTNRLG
ncbi:MAG: hypothetical protein R2839_00100 [Thermomicrobiales bacterium]